MENPLDAILEFEADDFYDHVLEGEDPSDHVFGQALVAECTPEEVAKVMNDMFEGKDFDWREQIEDKDDLAKFER
jgi:hypothetical protein